MPNKPRDTQYGEFRVITEWQRRNRRRFKPVVVPSLAAFILMIGRRYARAAQSLANSTIAKTVPGSSVTQHWNQTAADVCANMLAILGDTFDAEDWYAAVADVCGLLGIVPTSEPLDDVPAEQFAQFVEEIQRVSHTRGSE